MGAFRDMLGDGAKRNARGASASSSKPPRAPRTEREIQLGGLLCALVGFILGRLTAPARDAPEDEALDTESVSRVIHAHVALPRDVTGETSSPRGFAGAIARVAGGGRDADADADARAMRLGAELALQTESFLRDSEVERSVISSELEATSRGLFDDATSRRTRASTGLAWDDASMDYDDFSLKSMEKYGVDVSMTLSDDGVAT